MLDGELTVRLGPDGDEAGVRAGTLVRVPPLVVHGYRNGAGAELRYLNCHAPGTGFAAYLRALRDGAAHAFDQEPPPPGGGRPAGEASVGGEVVLVDRPGVRIRLLADTPAIAWAEVAVAGGAPPPPTHVHRRHAESVFVLDGGMAVTAGARRLWMEAGSWLTLPAGVPHAYPVAADGPVRLLALHTPNAGFGPFVRAVRDGGGADEAAARAGFDLDRVP